jgi:hypothetical protein
MRRVLFTVLFSMFVLVPVVASPAEQAQCSSKACDLDGDGYGSLLGDYGSFFAAFGSTKGNPGYDPKVDLDGDGAVTNNDFKLLMRFCPLGGN